MNCLLSSGHAAPPAAPPKTEHTEPSRVLVVHDPKATEAFKPQAAAVRRMAVIGITNLMREASTRAAWKRLLSTNDTVGIKIHCAPGADSGTRPVVVSAIIEQLLEFGLPPSRIIIWDRQRADLRRAGYYELAERYGVRVEGSVNIGFDPATFYHPDQPVVGPMIWSDLEFNRKGTNIGRNSHVSKLLSQEITRIIIISPLLNHNLAGAVGHLYSLAMGSVDNALRFESDLLHLKTAVPEIYALPSLSDHVALCITDALVCQYEGGERGLLHYSSVLNELRFSQDPVALDLLSIRELDRQRSFSTHPVPQHPSLNSLMELLQNAALLELGTADDSKIRTEYVP